MTRRDYVAIARAIMNARNGARSNDDWQSACDHLARQLALELAADNPRFDRARFYAAAGVAAGDAAA